jgi:Fe-S-cluster containining protein
MPRGNVSGCQSCRGQCCRAYTVPLTGRDAFVIATGLQLALPEFAHLLPEPEPSATGVKLAPGGHPLSLVLRRATDEPAPHRCVFLVTLDAGYERCGIHATRPYVCRTYPARFRHGSVAIRDDALCPPDAWNVSGLDLPAWRLTMLRQELEWTVYAYVVAAWNEALGASVEPADYFAWLLGVYARLEAMQLALAPGELDETVRRWLDVSGDSPVPAYMARVEAAVRSG